ncbi:uncharacterized [Tachysurus ichikawai]
MISHQSTDMIRAYEHVWWVPAARITDETITKIMYKTAQMWKRLLRVNTTDRHGAAGKTVTDDGFEDDVQTWSGETSLTLRENVEVKSLSLTTESCFLALGCPRTIAGDEHTISHEQYS